MNKALLLSVNPEFAEKIFDGEKTIELRRLRPRVESGDYLIIYVPTPCKSIVGVATVEQVLQARLGTLWKKVRHGCGITHTQFRSYFAGASVGYGIFLNRPAKLASSLALNMIRELKPNFSPQGYKYLSRSDIAEALDGLRPHRSVG